jgi:hypothetical protein
VLLVSDLLIYQATHFYRGKWMIIIRREKRGLCTQQKIKVKNFSAMYKATPLWGTRSHSKDT